MVGAAHDAFMVTGNGNFNGSSHFGESILSLNCASGPTLGRAGFYTPNSWSILNNGSGSNCPTTGVGALPLPAPEGGTFCALSDFDLGSGGAILARPTGIALTSGTTAENFVVLAGGKDGIVYVNSPVAMTSNTGADAANVATAACSTSGANSAVQCIGAAYLPSGCCTGNVRDYGLRGGSAFWAGTDTTHGNVLYVAGVQDTAIRAYQMDSTRANGQFVTSTTFGLGDWRGVHNATITYPGASPVVTWNSGGGSLAYKDAILWILDNSGYQRVGQSGNIAASPAGLYAYFAEPDTSHKLDLTSFIDTTNGPGAVKFMVPTVVNGHIFVAGQKSGSANFCSSAPCNGAVTMWH
jgi:hypothetical protein